MVKRAIRKQQITEKRREQILKAALEVFSQKGYAAATIPEIARLAGIAAGTIYLYYPGKRELFISAVKDFIITAPLRQLLGELQRTDIAVPFKGILLNRLKFAEGGRVAPLLSLMSEIQRDPELRALFAEKLLRPVMDMMEKYYNDGMAKGQMRKGNPAVVVRSIAGMIIGLVMLKAIEGEESPLSRLPQTEVSGDIVDFVLNGLLTDKARGKKQKARFQDNG